MRYIMTAALPAVMALIAAGCGSDKFDGPTVDAFTGRLTKDGKPVTFPDSESVTLKVIHDKAKSFGIPIAQDGTFKIGWMPIGKYSAILVRTKENAKGGPNMYNVPGGFEIVAGKTEYDIDLGKSWKQ
jgi:hypothetical protein